MQDLVADRRLHLSPLVILELNVLYRPPKAVQGYDDASDRIDSTMLPAKICFKHVQICS